MKLISTVQAKLQKIQSAFGSEKIQKADADKTPLPFLRPTRSALLDFRLGGSPLRPLKPFSRKLMISQRCGIWATLTNCAIIIQGGLYGSNHGKN